MNVIQPDKFVGVDSGPDYYWFTTKTPDGLSVARRDLVEGALLLPDCLVLSPGQIWVIEFPECQGLRRGRGGDVQNTRDVAHKLARCLLDRDPERRPLVYTPGANRIRYDVVGYVPRRDGHADRFIRIWCAEHGYGGQFGNDDMRDSLLATLWGEKVGKGEIDGHKWLAVGKMNELLKRG